jgi:uncharacterized lipoprotein YmbA
MKTLVKLGALTTLAFALSGCMSTGPKLAETRTVNLPDAAIMPTPEQVNDPGYRIVVSPVKYSDQTDAPFSRLVYDRIESTLLTAGNKVIDRDLASNLQRELEAAEAAGRFNTAGVQPADIAVMATITGTSLKYSHTERDSWVDDDGDRHTTPAHCDFTASSRVDVRAYVLPTMQKVGNWEFEGKESSETETSNSRCPISTASVNAMIADASNDAVESNIHNLLNPLAPNFYILERRDGEGGSVFRTNLGSSKGAFEGAVVKVSKIEKIPGDEYSEEKLTRIELGEAEITKDMSTDMSYIYISDEALANQIRRGHIVQLKHSECGVGENAGWLEGLCF